MRSVRRVLALSLLLLAGCGPSLAAVRPGDAARRGERFELEARDLEGRARTVAELAAGRVTLVDVWATWCVPCRDALLAWDRLSKGFGGRVAVVGISIDEDARQLPKFLARTPVSYPILWDRGGAASLDRLALKRVPTLLILDGQGRVRHVHEGWAGTRTVDAIEAELLDLLRGEAAPESPAR
jgi:thiol-disulfide isomerase/thioredoxin